jgi:hypothetical protein
VPTLAKPLGARLRGCWLAHPEGAAIGAVLVVAALVA